MLTEADFRKSRLFTYDPVEKGSRRTKRTHLSAPVSWQPLATVIACS